MSKVVREERHRFAQLRELELFRDCTDAELKLVDMLGAEIGLEPGRRITLTSARGLQLCVVRRGIVATVTADGCVTHVAGSVVPPLGDALRATPTTLVALEPARLIVYDSAESRHLLRALPQLVAPAAARTSPSQRQPVSLALLGQPQ